MKVKKEIEIFGPSKTKYLKSFVYINGMYRYMYITKLKREGGMFSTEALFFFFYVDEMKIFEDKPAIHKELRE